MSKIKKRTIKIIIAASIFLLTLFLNKLFEISPFVNLFIYVFNYLFISYDILIKAIKNVIYGKLLDENFLMTVATVGAFIIGQYSEGIAVILFYQIGELFQTISVRKSRQSIKSLINLHPDSANLVKQNNILTVPPDTVQIGDIIEIKAGEKIALDSIVIEGEGNINTALLTGESKPIYVKVGDKLTSGCINIDGTIRAKVITEYKDSTVNRIINLVQNAYEKKSKSEKFITKFARIYTPIVCGLALILAILPPILVGNWSEWIYRALCFLVVSCPCALVISIPLTFFAGIGCASKNGILIKGGTYIEKLPLLDTIIFDKTGTITQGTFSIKEVIPQNKKEEILQLATIAEQKSIHPLSKAILDTKLQVDCKSYTYTNIIGKGVIAKNKQNNIIAGNSQLLRDNNIEVKDIMTHNSVIYIANNNKYIGAIIVGDVIKEEAKDTINQLNKEKITTIMLSGDNKEITEQVSNEVNIKEFYYNLLPEDKMQKLEEIIKNKTVAFVGDGINDSPSLVRADIGISMGQIGSDSAIEASDIVIINDNLQNITKARNIAKKTMNIVKQNIIFTLAIKVIILTLSALGLSNMWWAIFGDVGVSVIAILNSLRAMKYKEKNSQN